MDDNAKNSSSYHLDQEILDARGINMTVEEVAGLPTTKYSERVQSLKLNDEDLAFLKGLRRRIKNRLASQNSRRRSMEHLRRLTRELRAVRACRDDALEERRALVMQRDEARGRCQKLRQYIAEILKERHDPTEVPLIDTKSPTESHQDPSREKRISVTDTKTPLLLECLNKIERDKNIFECRIDKLVQQSVNHIYKNEKKIFAKTVFITNEKYSTDIKSMVLSNNIEEDLDVRGKLNGLGEELKGMLDCDDGGVLNLCVKEGRRKSHGRKQSAPRRIAYSCTDSNDGVLDLKIKKDSQ
ncbi:LOW QUALITY PROTEIN: uncharacterized protein ACR2FA_009973 [Aphomia sociella]